MNRYTFSVIWMFLVLVCVGCESDNGPELRSLVDREFEQSISFSSSLDSILVAIGTSWRGREEPVEAYFSAVPSVSDSITMTFLVVGQTVDEEELAVIESRITGDTLFVWCGDFQPEYHIGENDFAKTSPVPPFLIPRRVDIAVPVGVRPVFIGRWYE